MSDSRDFIEDPAAVVPDTPEMRHELKQIASGRCAQFNRNFPASTSRASCCAKVGPTGVVSPDVV